MRSVSLRLVDLERKPLIPLGFEGENEYMTINFDCKTVFDKHPAAVPTLAVTPPQGDSYPAVVVRDGDIVSWTVCDSDLVYPGEGELQLTFVDGTIIGKTYKARTKVLDSITPSGEAPTPIQNWLTQAAAALQALPTEVANSVAALMWAMVGVGETLDPDDNVTVNYDPVNNTLTIGVPHGRDGEDGHTPAITANKVGKVATFYVDGVAIVQISDGQDADPTALIDDTSTAQNRTWSAKKLDEEKQSLKTEINSKADEPIGTKTAGKVYGLDSNLKPSWIDGGGSVDPSAIASAVADWCDENITEDPTVVIDKSLLTEGAAADAKAAGDRIGVLENMSNPKKTYLLTPFEQGTINGTTGEIETTDTTKCHVGKIAVKKGDSIAYARYNSKTASSATIFYYDENGAFLRTDTFFNNTTITISADGMIAIRCATNNSTIQEAIACAEQSFTATADVTPKIVKAIASAVENTEYHQSSVVLGIHNVNVIKDEIYKSTGISTGFVNGRRTDYVPVSEGDTIKYRLWCYFLASTYQYAVAVFNEDFELIDHVSGTGEENGFVAGTYTVPSGASYVMLSWNHDLTRDGWFEITLATLTEKIIDYIPRAGKLQKSILNGKQWCCLGDSLTNGLVTTVPYHRWIEERTGITAYNFGLSSTAITKDTASVDHNMATRYAQMFDDVDYVTVFGGTNDHGRSLPIGQWGDATEMTLYGAMKILCEGLINKYIGKKIGFLLPCPKCTTNDNVTTDYSYPSASFVPYIECIKDVCARYSIPVLDLYTQSGLHPSIEDYRTAYMPDGLHPNSEGSELLSYRIQAFLESL